MQNSKFESWKNFFEPNRAFDFYTISLLILHVNSTTWLFFPVSLTFMLTTRTRRNKMRCCVFYSQKDKMIIVETNTETDINVYIQSQSYGKYQALIEQPFFSLVILQINWVFSQLQYCFSVYKRLYSSFFFSFSKVRM
jgi:hypothetical protein